MPLRPDLYRRLVTRARSCGFGEVKTYHEDEEMIAHLEDDWAHPGRKKLKVEVQGEYYAVNCPFCFDTRNRLWINYLWGRHDPRVRGLNLWLAICYNENCLAKPGRVMELYDMIFGDVRDSPGRYDPLNRGRRRTGQLRSDSYRPAGPIVTRLDWLPDYHPGNLYLTSRGYDYRRVGRGFGLCYCFQAAPEFPLASHRIIAPVWFGGKLVGWQGRYLGEPPAGVPKWLTMSGMKKSALLYNFDRASKSGYVVVCEGVGDVWAYGGEAVALFGKGMSDRQANLIASTWGQGAVVILLDGDAPREAQKTHDALGPRVRRKVIVPLPADTDPGDYPREALRAYVLELARLRGVDLAALAPRQ
jgi:hypothetical protein